MATTRTAAYLWAKAHPQEARQLLVDDDFRMLLPAPSAAGDDWPLKQLRQQAIAARQAQELSMEWFVVPAEGDCGPQTQAAKHQQKLADLVAELLTGPATR